MTKVIQYFACLFFYAIVWCEIGFANTYYVGQTSAASDDNSGTSEERPFKTIARAIAKVETGDQIVVLPGDYRAEDSGRGPGVIPITKSGTPNHPIQFVARRDVLVSHVILQNVRHVSIDGFSFQSRPFSTNPRWQDMPNIVRDLPEESLRETDYLADWDKRRERVEKAFGTYLELVKSLKYQVAIDVEGCQDITLSRNSIDGYWAGIQCRGVDRADIRENKISHCVSGIYTWEPRPALTNSMIRGNMVTQCLDIGIDIRRDSRNVLIESNLVSFSGISHIAILDGVSLSRVRFNIVNGGGYYSEAMEFPGSSAINLNGVGKGNVVESNIAANQVDFTEVDGNGIILDLIKAGEKSVVRGNLSIANMGSGLNTTASPNADIYANLFVKNGLGGDEPRNGAGIKLSRDQDIDHSIHYNMFVLNRSAGILAYHTIAKQKLVNRNWYITRSAPIIWDGYKKNERAYHELSQVQAATHWESDGMMFRLPR